MRQFAGTLLFAGALCSTAVAQSGLGLAPPNPGFVIGFEWRKIVNSSLGAEVTDQIKKSPMSAAPGMPGLQEALMNDLDSVLIATPASALAKAKPGAKPPVLIVITGRFHPDKLSVLLKQNAHSTEMYRSVELIASPEGPAAADQTRIAFLDATTIVGGDRSEVRAAIDRFKTGHLTAAGSAGLLSGVAALASKNDIWMIFDMPPGALKDAPPMALQMFAGVKGAELGLSFEQGLALLVNIRTQDASSAGSMAQALQGLLAMGAMSQNDSPQLGELARKIRIAPESSRVTLSLSLDRAELQKMIADAKTKMAAAPAPGSKHIGAPAPVERKPIRIVGLDSGPIEVPQAAPNR